LNQWYIAAPHRVGRGDPDSRVPLLQEQRGARERSAGSDRAGEAVDLAAGLPPDLWPGAAEVAFAVRGVVPLVGPQHSVRLGRRELLRHPLGYVHVVVRVLVWNRGNLAQLGAAEPQHVFLFLALRVRDHDHGAVAARVADEREADPGVAGGALDDDPAGLEHAAPLGVQDDVERGAVLDRPARVQELGLPKDRAAGQLGRLAQLDQRGIADACGESVAEVHQAL
jgi:hypothetical protein